MGDIVNGRPITDIDRKILPATDRWHERTPRRVAEIAGVDETVAASSLRRLRARMLVDVDGSRPSRYLRTHAGDQALEDGAA
jgi:hypothetical protein